MARFLGVVGWAKIFHLIFQRGVQLILASSWVRPAILVAGKGSGGCFDFFGFFTFIPVPLSPLSLSFTLLSLLYLFSLFLGDDTKWPTRVDVSETPTQSINLVYPSLDSLEAVEDTCDQRRL